MSAVRERLLQTPDEWHTRNRVLSESLCALVAEWAPDARSGLDIGCQTGRTTDRYADLTGFSWEGIDPAIQEAHASDAGARLQPGTADRLPFDDDSFDVLILANVFEHILPDRRVASMAEMRRVLVPGGVVVGQIPNPYFPIESHSRLPFMGWLPVGLQHRYWRLSPSPWEHDFFVVTPKHLRRDAIAGGLEPRLVRNFNYPPEVIPEGVRWAARALQRPMRFMPWAWQFVLAGA